MMNGAKIYTSATPSLSPVSLVKLPLVFPSFLLPPVFFLMRSVCLCLVSQEQLIPPKRTS